MKRQICFLLALITLTVFCVGFAPFSQNETPLISIDMDALIQQVKESLNVDTAALDVEAALAALELRITALETQMAELERIAQLPTATPAPTTAVAAGTETVEPTRTPNPSGYDCVAQRLTPYYFGEFSAGAEFLFTVNIENTGTKTWGPEVTILFLDGLKAEKDEHYAYALPLSSVAPGDSFQINIPMVAPTVKTEISGKYESLYALNNGEENFCEFLYAIYTP